LSELPSEGFDKSAETPRVPRTPGHPADPARCHVQDGPAVSVSTAQMIACTAALSWMLHDRDGTILDAGRRRRRRTSLDNLISLCKHHHMLVHDRGYLITAKAGGTVTFYRPDGTLLPSSPALPDPEGTIEDCHDAGITPDTIIPAWYGEHLDLDYAIYTCFANADYQARHPGQDQSVLGVPPR
jgi:hypothetical protein